MIKRNSSLIFISLFIFTACGGGGGSYDPPANPPAAGCTPSTTNLCITVVGGKYVVQNSSSAGVSQKTLTLNSGTYVFDQSDSSNANHPLRLSTTSNGTHGGGSAYATGVTTSGTAGTDGKTQIVIGAGTATTLYYYCTNHSGMGGQINIVLGNQSGQVEFTETQ
tara:strand:+ start:338 stop:832 length:495 start_codon:yes stop_codon:yes gene_type:complete